MAKSSKNKGRVYADKEDRMEMARGKFPTAKEEAAENKSAKKKGAKKY